MTDYTYFAHGGIDKVTRPAATTAADAPRPQTRYIYTAVNPASIA